MINLEIGIYPEWYSITTVIIQNNFTRKTNLPSIFSGHERNTTWSASSLRITSFCFSVSSVSAPSRTLPLVVLSLLLLLLTGRSRSQEFFFKTPHSKSKRPYITLAKGLISNVSQKALYSMHKNKL